MVPLKPEGIFPKTVKTLKFSNIFRDYGRDPS